LIDKITLTEFIHTKEFTDFQNDILIDYHSQFEGFTIGDKLDSIGQLEDVFLLQKAFYEDFNVYLVFPIAAKYIYERATDMDCMWCWNSKVDLTEQTKENFMKYLLELVIKNNSDE